MKKEIDNEIYETEYSRIYIEAEKDANIFNLKCLGALAILSVLSIVFNAFGIFSVQTEIMVISMLTTTVLFCMPIAIYLINDKIMKKSRSVAERDWFRYLIIGSIFIGIGFICVSLSFHATILMAVPPLLAAQYRYHKRMSRIVLVLTLLLVPVSIYGSFFFGSPDRNFIKGMLTDEEAKIFANRLAIATPKRMLELFTHYTLPLLFGIIAIVLLVTGITNRNGRMLNKQTDLSKKIRQEMETRNEMQNRIIDILANLIETRDLSTGEHVMRTKKFVKMIAAAMQQEEKYRYIMTDKVIDMMENAAPLHDVGKIVVSDTILLKPARLTPEEFDKMKIHTTVGGKLISELFAGMNDVEFLKTAEEIAVSHHEWWNGNGYPSNLKGEEIPIAARIMAIADVYDALISVRVYKDAIPPKKALEIIFSESGTHFDPDILRVVEGIKDDLIAAVEPYIEPSAPAAD